jgi:hypothetical protein
MKWYLARQDSPTTVKNRGVVLRHITNPAVKETIEYADQQKDKGEGNGRGKSIFYIIGQAVPPSSHVTMNCSSSKY